ncbi:hypothetical protein MKO06_14175 [Gramella sp. GC03-9]|uniref:Thioredoxin domain-containing protein n=1 Tax=Christiangramia oceanisediminis TaxID=2920386 RepID=A0A9X2KZK3_9FLAO|nr:hypothetical protein [Gramella oceanisediminis]MCP9201061.1 hypothetical protein [Gramella oceanisediminis]
MKNLYYILCCALILTGCQNEPQPSTIFVGGQINNPETDYVVISKENKIIDTLFLNRDNQFGKNFQDLQAGIYTFRHPPESQVMYMEPGDSIVIWLNTLAFDQSLNFSGEGAEKSNFLLDMFLNNQKNNDLILTYHKIEPQKFAQVSDSIRRTRLSKLEKLKEKNEFSEDFLEIAKTVINYEFYDLRERYSFLIKKYYTEFAEKIPEDFHDYRDEINFNDERLQDYYVYTNLIDDYLRTKSIEHCALHHEDSRRCFNLNSFSNIQKRIQLMDSLTEISALKNEFISRLSTQAITMAENKKRIDSVIQLLEEVNYVNIDEIRNLAIIQSDYFTGNTLKDVTVLNPEGYLIKYGEVINKPSITYAWSIYNPAHHRWQHAIIEDLKQKYPELDYVGVNIDLGERNEWLRTLETFGYDKSHEYQIAKRKATKETYKKYLNKVLFVDPEGTIIRGDIQFGSNEFENEILEFLNQ